MTTINGMTFYNADCMDIMKQYPDKYFSLAIVDPPYGIGEDGSKNHMRGKLAQAKKYTPKSWDKNAPSKEYFEELVRISKNQIIWGANHFISKIPFDSPCWIVWDKDNGTTDFADCELAYSNFKTAVRKFKWTWNGMLQEKMNNKQKRIHPTEKPIELYDFCLKNYAKNGFKIIDTHLGSGSIALAIDKANRLDNMNLEFVGIELDKEYFDAAMNRINNHCKQSTIFDI